MLEVIQDRTRTNTLLAAIAIGVWALVLQNAGILPTLITANAQTTTNRVIDVRIVGSDTTLDVNLESAETPLDVNVSGSDRPLDINLRSIVGRDLVESQSGMTIGVAGEKNTIVPIHWGEVTVIR